MPGGLSLTWLGLAAALALHAAPGPAAPDAPADARTTAPADAPAGPGTTAPADTRTTAPTDARTTAPADARTTTSTAARTGADAPADASPASARPDPAPDLPSPADAPPRPRTGPRASAPRRAPAQVGEIPPHPPRDPNDTPFLRPPNNQPRHTRLRTSPDLRRGYSSVRRFAVTLAPVFASFRLPFRDRCTGCRSGDPPPRQHGVGLAGELDFQVIRWIWLRAQASYSVHPVDDVRVADDDDNVTVIANRGTIRALGFGAGPVVALDLGRFIPLIEGGIGALRVATPPGARAGQFGESCLEDRVCDVGLTCGGDNTCQQGLIADLYFGGAIDVLVRRHISLGAQFRYHALITAPGTFPVYLVGGLRLGIRF